MVPGPIAPGSAFRLPGGATPPTFGAPGGGVMAPGALGSGVMPPGAGMPSGTDGVSCPGFGVCGAGTAPGLPGPAAIGGLRGGPRGPGATIIGGLRGAPRGPGGTIGGLKNGPRGPVIGGALGCVVGGMGVGT